MTTSPIGETTGAQTSAVAMLPTVNGTKGSAIAAAQRREQTRKAILEAAWAALARDGYEKITTRRIAELAGVNVATLHYYFGSKELLLSEATRFALKGTESRMRAAIDQAQTAVAALDNLFTAIWDMVQDQPGALRYDLVVRGFRDEQARQDVLAIYATYQRLTEDLIERHLREGGTLKDGVTPSVVAHYMLSAVDGVLLQHVLTSDAGAARSALALIRNHALSLLNARVNVVLAPGEFRTTKRTLFIMTHQDFERMVLPHRDALYGHALSLTRNADEAEDLVQETTLRALRGFESFRSEGPIRAWLLTILRNLFINSYRTRVRAPRSVSLDALENPDPIVPVEPGPERAVFSRLENEALARAVAALPADYREVLVLSDMRGMSYQEISARIDVPIGTVRSRLSRARNRVRRSLFAWRPDAQGSSKMAGPSHSNSRGASSVLPA